MKTIIIIQSILIIFILIHYFHQKNINYILKKKYRGFIEASNDYSRYIQSYVSFYREMQEYRKAVKKKPNEFEIVNYIILRFRSHFKHCEKSNE